MGRLNTLDLFSGIGGISLALRSRCKTIAYCDKDADCRAVLQRCMAKGLIDKAPVFEDVVKLGAKDLPKDVSVVTAGFPCQDISAAGNRVGITGERSGLFTEIIRLVKEMKSVKYVFLENVPAIMSNGIDVVEKALKALGFDLAYGVFQANETGAIHVRKRWFCLAVRNSLAPGEVLVPPRPRSEPVRLVRKGRDTPTFITRYRVMGNSVVPQVVALAWNTLSRAIADKSSFGRGSHRSDVGNVYLRPKDGVHTVVRRQVKLARMNRIIRLPRGLKKTIWATPTAEFNHPFHTFSSDRGFRNLFNQVYYDFDMKPGVPRNELIRDYAVNPRFVEWLMGYEPDYTKA
jgi:site-specific DNA-cytosine methylase